MISNCNFEYSAASYESREMLDFSEFDTEGSSSDMLIDCFRSFNKVTEYEMYDVKQLNDFVLFAISKNKIVERLALDKCGEIHSHVGLQAVITNCPNLYYLRLSRWNRINKQDLVSLFEIKNNLTQITICYHNTLDTESVISILESTFKHRPDESQGPGGGSIKEKIQNFKVYECSNVNHNKIKQYLRDNQDCYVVKYN